MNAKELTVEVANLMSQVERLNATVAALVEHDKVLRATVRELRARPQPDTLERRAKGAEPFAAARMEIIAERGLAKNAWVPYTEIRARMEADRAQPPSPADEEVAL